MDEYAKLNDALTRAIRRGEVKAFIDGLKKAAEARPQTYLGWLFLARAYDELGDRDRAAEAYALTLGRIRAPEAKLLDEVYSFSQRYRRAELIAMMEQQFGSGDSKDGKAAMKLQTSKPSIIRRQSPTNRRDSSVKDKDVGANLSLVSEAIGEANRALQNGELEVALERLDMVLATADADPQPLYLAAQILQRMARFDEAISNLEKGITSAATDNIWLAKLLNLKAQVLQSSQQWVPAAEAYEKLIQLQERRPAARRFSRLQLVAIYRRLSRISDARALINQVVLESPQDQVAARIQAEIEQQALLNFRDEGLLDDDVGRELDVDLQDEESAGIEYISPMLKGDLESAEFHDGKILAKGGHPDELDALRLLKLANDKTAGMFGERYPLFLEAAKAYNELPIGSYDLGSFSSALARYAMLKGEGIVSDFRRRLLSGNIDLERLRRLRDSAASYVLESLALQVRVDAKYALVSVGNHFRVQLAYALVAKGKPNAADVFVAKLGELFRDCLESADSDFSRVAYECAVTWGAVSARVWWTICNSKGGIGKPLRFALTRSRRERGYHFLSEIGKHTFDLNQVPKEVLQSSFLERRRRIGAVVDFFARFQQVALTVQTLKEVHSLWQTFPTDRNVLLDTDSEIRDNIGAILAILLPFSDRSTEERTGILFTTRSNIENLLRFIEDNPTYWGRVEFEPLLRRWQVAIRSIEQRRLSEIHPKLVAQLEPPLFRSNGDLVEGGLLLRNEGKGTAEGVKLRLEVWTQDGIQLLCYLDDEVSDEIKAKEGATHGRLQYQFHVDKSDLRDGIETAYKLRLKMTPIFSHSELDQIEQDFTLEVGTGSGISEGDIPWDEFKFPTEHMFKGRERFISQLTDHLRSSARNQTYILYGLTRTGKTSILRYLEREIDLQPVIIDGQKLRFISFSWQLGEARGHSNAADMWGYLLGTAVVSKLEGLVQEGRIGSNDVPQMRNPNSVRFKDWGLLLTQMRERGLYPVFLLDEFSYYREMVDAKRTDGSFLAAIREYALAGRASFVFAGTYDLTKLIQDPAYGVRGQLVNTIDKRVSRIEREPAIALMQVMTPRLWFTPDAVEHILALSWQIPYFIQVVCKNCGLFAASTGRGILGFPEVDAVIGVLVGEVPDSPWIGVSQLPAGRFQSNMYMPTDPPSISVLLTTICDLTKGQTQPRMVSYPEIQEVWHRHGLKNFQANLAEAIRELLDREVLIPGKDEDEFAYRISVDLFRRWWGNEHKNLKLELDSLKRED